MTSTQAIALLKEPAESANRSAVYLAAWERNRKAKWTRTDTVRHLDDRGQALVDCFCRSFPKEPAPRSRRIGNWLKDNRPQLFDAAHNRLAAAKDDQARESLLCADLFDKQCPPGRG